MKASEIAAGAGKEVARQVDYLERLVADNEGRYERASDAVAYLCAEVARYLDPDDPEVGYDRLAEARQLVLSMHSGNFSPPLDTGSVAGVDPAAEILHADPVVPGPVGLPSVGP